MVVVKELVAAVVEWARVRVVRAPGRVKVPLSVQAFLCGTDAEAETGERSVGDPVAVAVSDTDREPGLMQSLGTQVGYRPSAGRDSCDEKASDGTGEARFPQAEVRGDGVRAFEAGASEGAPWMGLGAL